MSGWLEIRATLAELPADWSPMADLMHEHGCPSTQTFDRPPAIVGHLASTEGALAQAEKLAAALRGFGAADVSIATIPDVDWSELWRAHFKPWRIGNRFVVRPSWEPFEAGPDDLVIVLDPGQAFGTGDHPTTRMCLQLMELCIGDSVKSLLDLGTGTGILAIAARRLGVPRVIASDIDPVAVEVAQTNAKVNGVDVEAFAAEGMDDERLAGPWGAVVSNIISATLIRLAPEITARLEPGGIWIVSGVLNSNWPDVRAGAEACGLELERQLAEGDWIAAALRAR